MGITGNVGADEILKSISIIEKNAATSKSKT